MINKTLIQNFRNYLWVFLFDPLESKVNSHDFDKSLQSSSIYIREKAIEKIILNHKKHVDIAL